MEARTKLELHRQMNIFSYYQANSLMKNKHNTQIRKDIPCGS